MTPTESKVRSTSNAKHLDSGGIAVLSAKVARRNLMSPTEGKDEFSESSIQKKHIKCEAFGFWRDCLNLMLLYYNFKQIVM